MTFSHNIESLLVSPTSHALKKKKDTLVLIDWEDTSILSKKREDTSILGIATFYMHSVHVQKHI